MVKNHLPQALSRRKPEHLRDRVADECEPKVQVRGPNHVFRVLKKSAKDLNLLSFGITPIVARKFVAVTRIVHQGIHVVGFLILCGALQQETISLPGTAY